MLPSRSRDLLRQAGDAAAEAAHLAVVGLGSPAIRRNRWTCRRRCGRRCRRVRWARWQRDLFEQQRSADAEVDVLEGDQGHVAILPFESVRQRDFAAAAAG
jgi:hypothetical protein